MKPTDRIQAVPPALPEPEAPQKAASVPPELMEASRARIAESLRAAAQELLPESPQAREALLALPWEVAARVEGSSASFSAILSPEAQNAWSAAASLWAHAKTAQEDLATFEKAASVGDIEASFRGRVGVILEGAQPAVDGLTLAEKIASAFEALRAKLEDNRRVRETSASEKDYAKVSDLDIEHERLARRKQELEGFSSRLAKVPASREKADALAAVLKAANARVSSASPQDLCPALALAAHELAAVVRPPERHWKLAGKPLQKALSGVTKHLPRAPQPRAVPDAAPAEPVTAPQEAARGALPGKRAWLAAGAVAAVLAAGGVWAFSGKPKSAASGADLDVAKSGEAMKDVCRVADTRAWLQGASPEQARDMDMAAMRAYVEEPMSVEWGPVAAGNSQSIVLRNADTGISGRIPLNQHFWSANGNRAPLSNRAWHQGIFRSKLREAVEYKSDPSAASAEAARIYLRDMNLAKEALSGYGYEPASKTAWIQFADAKETRFSFPLPKPYAKTPQEVSAALDVVIKALPSAAERCAALPKFQTDDLGEPRTMGDWLKAVLQEAELRCLEEAEKAGHPLASLTPCMEWRGPMANSGWWIEDGCVVPTLQFAGRSDAPKFKLPIPAITKLEDALRTFAGNEFMLGEFSKVGEKVAAQIADAGGTFVDMTPLAGAYGAFGKATVDGARPIIQFYDCLDKYDFAAFRKAARSSSPTDAIPGRWAYVRYLDHAKKPCAVRVFQNASPQLMADGIHRIAETIVNAAWENLERNPRMGPDEFAYDFIRSHNALPHDTPMEAICEKKDGAWFFGVRVDGKDFYPKENFRPLSPPPSSEEIAQAIALAKSRLNDVSYTLDGRASKGPRKNSCAEEFYQAVGESIPKPYRWRLLRDPYLSRAPWQADFTGYFGAEISLPWVDGSVDKVRVTLRAAHFLPDVLPSELKFASGPDADSIKAALEPHLSRYALALSEYRLEDGRIMARVRSEDGVESQATIRFVVSTNGR